MNIDALHQKTAKKALKMLGAKRVEIRAESGEVYSILAFIEREKMYEAKSQDLRAQHQRISLVGLWENIAQLNSNENIISTPTEIFIVNGSPINRGEGWGYISVREK